MKVHFESCGVQLCGELEEAGSKDELAVVLCHGFDSNKNSGTYSALAKTLGAEGVTSFRFDFFGHGESEGKFEDITPSIGVQNALDAIAFLKEKGYSKIGLCGGSFGGYVGYMAAAKTPDLVVLALKCPVADFSAKGLTSSVDDSPEVWKEKGVTMYNSWDRGKIELNYSYAEDALQSVAFDVLEKIQAPTIIVHGEKDESVPIDQSRKAAELIPHCLLVVIDGADHRMKDGDQFEQVISLLSGYILEHR